MDTYTLPSLMEGGWYKSRYPMNVYGKETGGGRDLRREEGRKKGDRKGGREEGDGLKCPHRTHSCAHSHVTNIYNPAQRWSLEI